MPYEQLEEIRSRKQEKVAIFLTAQHVGGILCVTVPVYIATLHFPFILRTLILITAATLGICLTLEIGGLPVYERLLWRVRGAIRVRTSNTSLSPEQFTGIPAVHIERALPAGGPIRVVRVDQQTAQHRRIAGTALYDMSRSVAAPGNHLSAVSTSTLPATSLFSERARTGSRWDGADLSTPQDERHPMEAVPQVESHANA